MATLALQRCLNHSSREAVCRCRSCHHFFCRECVVLFESRLLCASCLAAASASGEPTQARSGLGIAGAALIALGLVLAWLLFYLAGWSILQFRAPAPIALLACAALGFGV